VFVSVNLLYLSVAVSGQQAGFITYEYSDYGVKIDYPENWLVEELAFDDRYLKVRSSSRTAFSILQAYRA
jgi:hypothetical protein